MNLRDRSARSSLPSARNDEVLGAEIAWRAVAATAGYSRDDFNFPIVRPYVVWSAAFPVQIKEKLWKNIREHMQLILTWPVGLKL